MKICAENGRIHFIGIGGISMSALAKWCVSEGFDVSGSDKSFSETLNLLADLGVKTYVGLNPSVAADSDLVVYSAAIAEDNAELVAAKNAGVKRMCRHEFLGEMQKEFGSVIAVSGTHGKTTVTALLAAIFKNAGKSFTAHVGGEAADIDGNLYSCGKEYFITEACEYKRSFLSLRPDCLVILNIESDHPDCFSDTAELCQTFANFAENVRNGGFIVKNGEYYMRVAANLYGRHNILNALAAILVASRYGVDKQIILSTLENFKWVKRRFEQVAEINGARVIVDYAHHPSEIVATIASARALPHNCLRVYFQPHTYSRTAKYFTAFAAAFSEADEVSMLPTFAARETADMGVTSFELFYYINANFKEAKYFDNFIAAASNIAKTAMPDDIILILGAGDINEMAKLL